MSEIASPTAMHEFADEQSTPNRFVSGRAFSVGVTVHEADATEGASSNAAVAIKTRRTDRSDICALKLRLRSGRVKPSASSRAARGFAVGREEDSLGVGLLALGVQQNCLDELLLNVKANSPRRDRSPFDLQEGDAHRD